jgi:hypothetical protein
MLPKMAIMVVRKMVKSCHALGLMARGGGVNHMITAKRLSKSTG